MSIRCYDTDVAKYKERLINPKKNKKMQVESFYDPYVLGFSIGCNGTYHRTDTFNSFVKEPCLFRGMGKSPQIKQCIENNIDWYYIDTGYLGNDKYKTWHRISKNNFQVQHIMDIKDSQLVPDDIKRFEKNFGTIKPGVRTYGNKILIEPPSQKVFNHFGGDAKAFTDNLVERLEEVTDKEIVKRMKPTRGERLQYSLVDQLKSDKYGLLITFNSIAAAEAIIAGYPAIVLGPNVAHQLSGTTIDEKSVNEPYMPDTDTVNAFLLRLSLCQFNQNEILSGYAWETLQRLQKNQKHITTYADMV